MNSQWHQALRVKQGSNIKSTSLMLRKYFDIGKIKNKEYTGTHSCKSSLNLFSLTRVIWDSEASPDFTSTIQVSKVWIKAKNNEWILTLCNTIWCFEKNKYIRCLGSFLLTIIFIQKQPPQAFCKKGVLTNFIKVNFTKFLRTPFLQNTSGRLLLIIYFKRSTDIDSFQVWLP